ncbi:MAG: 2-oxoglutarate dehydrogenase E1 component [Sphingomonadaceae bacterium]|nr:2-oxoglutarate dehydrogenase E1 component [Sphingomonadaceae bacterium]
MSNPSADAFPLTDEALQPGPSWARTNWPPLPDDALTIALDPTRMLADAPLKSSKAAGSAPAADPEAARRAAQDSVRALMLIRTYRVRGHLAANLDPLGLMHRELPADLTPEFHGFGEQDLDREVYIGGFLGLEKATVREIVDLLQRTYCGNIGFEYMHINAVEERRFIQERVEGRDKEIQFTELGKKAILNKVIEAEEWEKFLARKYVGTKRFGLDGGESMIPAMEALIKYGGQYGVTDMVIGMAHRGRLNMLANVLQKPFQAIFHEFAGGASTPEAVGGSGDVKYHLGTSTDRDFDGKTVHLSLAPNPSHLEAVNPVVLGKARAVMEMVGDPDREDSVRDQVLPVLIHGDAAFAGQGVVAECFAMSGVRGYATGGTIHFVINNQVGFTTSPQFARSSPYPTDIARTVQAPILHVNGDDPEAVTFCAKLAVEYRQTFSRDIVIDMWCYRRFGHNEADEPAFTQPLMYAAIRQHPPVSAIYAARLKRAGVVDDDWANANRTEYLTRLEDDFGAASGYRPNKADWFEGRWLGLGRPVDPITERRAAETGVAIDRLRGLVPALTQPPEGFAIHRTLERVLAGRASAIETGEGIDWATAEALAFTTLLQDGYGVRLSGQDVGRGTFSQRHALWYDQVTGAPCCPYKRVSPKFEVLDSILSEFGVLGFEYGYALAEPRSLVLWEAQFGDFANGAQVIIDQFIAAGEIKWLRANGLVMLLPHGYEGQGPEHSSARLERYLQLCAEDNIQVANCTTPANYFHILRRQLLRPFRKPLIMMTPKSLLRHKSAVSALSEFGVGTRFHRVLEDRGRVPTGEERTLILCSGKVYYDLADARDAAGRSDIYIARLEQLYPWPGESLAELFSHLPKLGEVVWAQEEPKNNGAWFFIEPLLEETLDFCAMKIGRPRYAGRPASAATATGLASRHAEQQRALIAEALGESRAEVGAAIGAGVRDKQAAG